MRQGGRTHSAIFFVFALVTVWLAAVPAFAQSDDAESIVVTALHAIPGEDDFPADVYVNGELAIEGFTKMMRSEPFELETGAVDVAVYASGADPTSSDAAVEATVELAERGNYVLVAHLSGEGLPVLAVYANDVSAIPMGQGRFVFRQTADIAPVDVSIGGDVVATSLANSGEVTIDLAAGVHELVITPSDGGEPLVTTDVELVEGELTAVFAITTLEADSIDLAVQTVTGLETAPDAVQTGTGGDAETDTPVRAAGLAGIGVGALLLAYIARRRFNG